MSTGISWTDETWNPTVGCSVLSPGCKHCYAMKMAARLEKMGIAHYADLTQQTKEGAVWNGTMRLAPPHIFHQPKAWKKGRKIFVNSMSDLFHDDIPDSWIQGVFGVMRECPQHTFQVLTKRAGRMCQWIMQHQDVPLPNVWLGVSIEDDERAKERGPWLKTTPAAVRFISAEPLLSSLPSLSLAGVDWLICGGESGPRYRIMAESWARSLRDRCAGAGVAFFMKQMSGKYPIPSDLMVRQFPNQEAAHA